jgi:ABC-type polysaccharide/polyol phosphate export permease
MSTGNVSPQGRPTGESRNFGATWLLLALILAVIALYVIFSVIYPQAGVPPPVVPVR